MLRLFWGKNAALSFVFEVLKGFTNCIGLYSVSMLLTSVWYFDNFWSSYGEVMGQLLSKLAMVGAPDADSRNKMEMMSRQIQDYETLVKQLKVWPSTEVSPLTVFKWSILVSCINKFVTSEIEYPRFFSFLDFKVLLLDDLILTYRS